MKKVLFSLSSYKIKEEPVKVLPSLSINLQCSFILIVLPLLRCSNSNPLNISVKIVEGGLCSFLFSLFYFYFYFFFYSLFLFLEQLRLGVISHAVTSVTT